jgi:hypothetical protein
MIDLSVQADYLADDAELGTVDMFMEAYVLWLFGFVMFCKPGVDSVIADASLDAVS